MVEKRRVMYTGHKGDGGVPIIMHGLKFEKGVVYPVTDGVYEYIIHIKNFVDVNGVRNVCVDWVNEQDMLIVSGAPLGWTSGTGILDNLS